MLAPAHARLWALHGLNPYTHVVAEIPGDPVNQYLGRTWPKALEPYTNLPTWEMTVGVPSS